MQFLEYHLHTINASWMHHHFERCWSFVCFVCEGMALALKAASYGTGDLFQLAIRNCVASSVTKNIYQDMKGCRKPTPFNPVRDSVLKRRELDASSFAPRSKSRDAKPSDAAPASLSPCTCYQRSRCTT